MILGIDASNIRSGGGVTHLVEVLRAADPLERGISKVIVWGSQSTLRLIEPRPWLLKEPLSVLERGLASRAFWQKFRLSGLAHAHGCDVLWVPGGSYAGSFRPVVTMSRNLLPFEWRELRRFGWSWLTVKMCLLRLTQSRSLRQADGVIFLTRYAQQTVLRAIGRTHARIAIVPHGVEGRFAQAPREQAPLASFSRDRPIRIVYVSIVDAYKHQWFVAEAVARLRSSGLPVALDLVGPGQPASLKRLRGVLDRVDPPGDFIRYCGPVPHAAVHSRYAEADICVFASSCENMPNILLEGMASGLPIACSRLGPMPEVLGEAGVYFDPEDVDDIARAMRTLIESAPLRARLARASFARVAEYSWSRCARETLDFLAGVAAAAAR